MTATLTSNAMYSGEGHDKRSLKTLSIDPCQQCEHKADKDGACEDQLDHADVLV